MSRIQEDIDMRDFVLPNGNMLELWEDKTEYKRVLHVAKKHARASDAGDGSADKPFVTIKKAADIADAGDMVLIHEGEYHETVRPLGSGKSPTEMLCFKGEEGAKVVITGAEILKGRIENQRAGNTVILLLKTTYSSIRMQMYIW